MAVNINGYPDNISNLYYTQKYYMYSRLGYFVSRFILEYTPSPIDSTLVKSKKMGNLAFINNSSKVLIICKLYSGKTLFASDSPKNVGIKYNFVSNYVLILINFDN